MSTYHLYYMRHIRAAINFLDLVLEHGRPSTRSSPKGFCKKLPENWLWSAVIFVGTRGRPGRLNDRERHGTGDKNTNFPSGSFHEFRLLRKISSGTNRKVVFRLHPKQNFRNFLVNGKDVPGQATSPPHLSWCKEYVGRKKSQQSSRAGLFKVRLS